MPQFSRFVAAFGVGKTLAVAALGLRVLFVEYIRLTEGLPQRGQAVLTTQVRIDTFGLKVVLDGLRCVRLRWGSLGLEAIGVG